MQAIDFYYMGLQEKYVLLDLRHITTYIFLKITSDKSEALPIKFCLQNLFTCKRMGT